MVDLRPVHDVDAPPGGAVAAPGMAASTTGPAPRRRRWDPRIEGGVPIRTGAPDRFPTRGRSRTPRSGREEGRSVGGRLQEVGGGRPGAHPRPGGRNEAGRSGKSHPLLGTAVGRHARGTGTGAGTAGAGEGGRPLFMGIGGGEIDPGRFRVGGVARAAVVPAVSVVGRRLRSVLSFLRRNFPRMPSAGTVQRPVGGHGEGEENHRPGTQAGQAELQGGTLHVRSPTGVGGAGDPARFRRRRIRLATIKIPKRRFRAQRRPPAGERPLRSPTRMPVGQAGRPGCPPPRVGGPDTPWIEGGPKRPPGAGSPGEPEGFLVPECLERRMRIPDADGTGSPHSRTGATKPSGAVTPLRHWRPDADIEGGSTPTDRRRPSPPHGSGGWTRKLRGGAS